jgi:type IV fimbrial biogenesis protein FimT
LLVGTVVLSMSPPRRASLTRAPARGFTLIELMVAVILIAVVAVAAIPAMQKANADRRAFSYATTAASIIRDARTRAIAHGDPVLVVLCSGDTCPASSAATDNGSIRVFDPASIVCPPTIKQSTCDSEQWTIGDVADMTDPSMVAAANNVSSPVDGLDLNGTGVKDGAENIVTEMANQAGTVLKNAYICFSPAGKAYLSTDTAPTQQPTFNGVTPMTGNITFSIARQNGGLKRTVIIPSNGAARVVSQ